MTKAFLLAVVAVAVTTSACARRPAPASGERESAAAIAEAVARLASTGDSAGIAKKLRSACSDPTTRSQCFETQLVPLASDGRVKLAMGALGELAELEPNVRTDGHVYAHAIGIAAGKTTRDVAAAFTQCSESFQSGCYHGVIQAWFARLDSIGKREANELCQPFRASEASRWMRFQCVHGMGHGLTMLFKHDLRAGLKGCDLLTDPWDAHSCYGGAFMENIVNVTNPHHPAAALNAAGHASASDSSSEHSGHHMAGTDHAAPAFKAVDSTDQQYPCSILEPKYHSACYGMQTSVMLHNNGGDMADAARACDAAPANMRAICYASLGRDISSYANQDHSEAIRMCSVGKSIYQPWCFYGVVKNFIDINARTSDGISFCRAVPGDSNKQVCYAAVGEQALVLTPDVERRKKSCEGSELAYVRACLYGASVNRELPPELARVYNSVER
jgi:hypothetical protein